MVWTRTAPVGWILRNGRRLQDLDETVQGLGRAMTEAGAPVWRVRLAMRTVHPLVTAVSAIWERGGGQPEKNEIGHGLEQRSTYVGSPLAQVRDTGRPYRRVLTDLGGEDHPVLHELHGRGATDYYATPLRFGKQPSGILVLASDAPEGFADEDIAAFENIGDALTPVVEVFRLRRLATAVAEAYLGPRSGRRVLAGDITRGHIDKMEAAIFVSDLRDWTAINARMSAEETVALANRYFDVIAGAVAARGGEILKFLGDGVLAVFPAASGSGPACKKALSAAQTALQQAADLDPPLNAEFGIGLHCGTVMYGNVGAADRLDFTVLGQAVNIAARIEAQCRSLGHPLLFSAEFAALVPGRARAAGTARLKGLETPQQLFTL
ncbi:adenylate/guanylate cyclase domain-containing protein [Roseobacteraceae bacterium NS-SX3]